MTAPSKWPPRSPGPLIPWRCCRVPPAHSALFVDSAPRQLLKLMVPSLDVSSAQNKHHVIITNSFSVQAEHACKPSSRAWITRCQQRLLQS